MKPGLRPCRVRERHGGVVAYALVGGGAALGLALGTAPAPRDRGAVAAEAGADPGQILLAVAVLLLWVGWLEPRLLDADAEAAAALVLLSWAAAVGAALVGALFGAVFRGGGGRLEALPGAVLAGVIAAPALGVQAGALTALIFGAVVGLLHALVAPALVRRNAAAELAAAFGIGGIGAALAPALVGPDGFLFVPVAENLPVQLLGAAVALALGLGGGLLLGLLLRHVTGLSRPRVAAAAKAPAADTTAA